MLSTLVTYAFFDAVDKEQIFICNGNFKFWFCEYTRMPVFKSDKSWRGKFEHEPGSDVPCYSINIDCVDLLRAAIHLKDSARIYEYIFGVVSMQVKKQLEEGSVPAEVESCLINIYGNQPEVTMLQESIH